MTWTRLSCSGLNSASDTERKFSATLGWEFILISFKVSEGLAHNGVHLFHIQPGWGKRFASESGSSMGGAGRRSRAQDCPCLMICIPNIPKRTIYILPTARQHTQFQDFRNRQESLRPWNSTIFARLQFTVSKVKELWTFLLEIPIKSRTVAILAILSDWHGALQWTSTNVSLKDQACPAWNHQRPFRECCRGIWRPPSRRIWFGPSETSQHNQGHKKSTGSGSETFTPLVDELTLEKSFKWQ